MHAPASPARGSIPRPGQYPRGGGGRKGKSQSWPGIGLRGWQKIHWFAATWMELEIVILSEGGQTEKDKCHMISIMCVILKMIQMNLFRKQK